MHTYAAWKSFDDICNYFLLPFRVEQNRLSQVCGNLKLFLQPSLLQF